MVQLFSPKADRKARIGIAAFFLAIVAVLGGTYYYARSDRFWNVGVAAEQPIPFRHDLHAGSLSIDCRYCHNEVETSAAAGMPSADTCLNCHSQILAGSGVLEPLRTAIAFGVPVEWTSVHRLPSFAYFHHGIHVQKGVGCETCHGRVDEMEETVTAETLSMGWCLECHENPGPNLRPRDAVFMMGWEPDPAQSRRNFMALHEVATEGLTDCSTCHR